MPMTHGEQYRMYTAMPFDRAHEREMAVRRFAREAVSAAEHDPYRLVLSDGG
ncbi:MAG: hypothetical protein ACLP01_26570 [Solirubrobacteraceae bacterium]